MSRFNPYAKSRRYRKAAPKTATPSMTGQVLGRKGPDLWVRIKGAMGAIVVPAATTAMLAFGGVQPVLATNYFTSETVNSGSGTTATSSYTVNYLIAPVDAGADRDASTYVAVVFDPESWTASYNTGVTFPLSTINYSYTGTTSSVPEFTLTFNSGANAADISKAVGTAYTTSETTSTGATVAISGDTSLWETDDNSTSYIASLIFEGSNTVSGTIDIDDGTLTISGATVSLQSTVGVGALTIDATGEYAAFGGAVTATGAVSIAGDDANFSALTATTDNITISGDRADFDGAVDAAAGSITISGDDADFGSTVDAYTSISLTGSDAVFGGAVTADTGDIAISGDDAEFDGAVAATGGSITISGDRTDFGSTVDAGGTISISGIDTYFRDNVTAPTITFTDNRTAYFDPTVDHGDSDSDVDITITGDVTTSTDSEGVLTFEGDATVTGTIGTSSASLSAINAGVANSVTYLQEMVYVDRLNYVNDGSVSLSGEVTGSAAEGLIGTIDFNDYAGTLLVDGDVNLTVGSTSTYFADANAATLTFLGTSTITGDLSAANAGSTFYTIRALYDADETDFPSGNGPVTFVDDVYAETIYAAGDDGDDVFFDGDVHVSGNTLHVGAGDVDLDGDLYGPLVFDGDGTVTFADGKSVLDESETVLGTITTGEDNEGTINYEGSTTLTHGIGTSLDADFLKAVNFHTTDTNATGDVVTQVIDNDVFATTTTFGNSSESTVVNITATDLFLGDSVTLNADNVTLNTAGTVDASSGTVVFDHVKNTDGTLTVGTVDEPTTITQSDFGTGTFTTAGSTLNFTAGTSFGGLVDETASSQIAGGTGSVLDMDGDETVNVSLLGSLRNDASYALIDAASSTATDLTGVTLTDNSFVIDTDVTLGTDGNLLLTASRDADTYVTKSSTLGHFSNDAAVVLGTLAADGTDYSADMQRVLNKLDIDQWGYGNTEANLADQVMSLAPIANNSVSEASFAASSLALRTVGDRIDGLRSGIRPEGGAEKVQEAAGFWVKGYSGWLSQDADGMYDGYEAATWGSAIGTDYRVSRNAVLGFAFAYSSTDLDQKDFRTGDSMSIEGLQGSLYGSLDLSPDFYVEAQAACTFNTYEGDRSTAVGRTASSEYDGTEWSGRLGAGLRINLADNHVLTPMVGGEVSQLKLDGYSETGAGALDLEVDGRTLNSARSLVGMRYSASARLSDRVRLNPELSATWYHEFEDRTADVVASYEGGGADFTTAVSSVDDDMLNASFGLNAQIGGDTNVALRYDFGATDSSTNHEMQLQYRYSF